MLFCDFYKFINYIDFHNNLFKIAKRLRNKKINYIYYKSLLLFFKLFYYDLKFWKKLIPAISQLVYIICSTLNHRKEDKLIYN